MLKPASLFTDGAVLCRGREIRVFGEADPGTAVRVVLTDRAGSLLGEAVCESSGGRFLAVLPPQQARKKPRRRKGSAASARTEASRIFFSSFILSSFY